MQIDLVLKADYAESYVADLVADTLGPGAVINVIYSEPDADGLVCAVGEAQQR